MVLLLILCHFYAISILFAVQPPETPTLWTTSEQKECWRPRGVRGCVDVLSAAHPTD
jgi:hypothetical protein